MAFDKAKKGIQDWMAQQVKIQERMRERMETDLFTPELGDGTQGPAIAYYEEELKEKMKQTVKKVEKK